MNMKRLGERKICILHLPNQNSQVQVVCFLAGEVVGEVQPEHEVHFGTAPAGLVKQVE